MKSWQEDLLTSAIQAGGELEIFSSIEAAAHALGFEYCAYGFRAPVPLTNPKTVLLNNYPQQWRERYEKAGYLHTDPTVLHARKSQTPLVWDDRMFASTRDLWEEARSFGLRVGWAQSSLDGVGVGGMLTLARSGEPLTQVELDCKEHQLRWLVHTAHMSLARVLKAKQTEHDICLTFRELEILKWTADGKSSQEIADILAVSKNTVDFHVKNAVAKMQTANKTAATVRAAMLGLLN